MFKLGKKPAVYNKKMLHFEHYIKRESLPLIPAQFGHENAVTSWGMLGNDTVGDCVFAGADHETMLWTVEEGKPAHFTADNAISDYSAVTGYDSSNPRTDQGTNVQDAMDYRKSTGLIDAAGNRHKIGGYLALEPGNLRHVMEALYLFSAVAVGIEFPDSAMDQFNAMKPWAVVPGASVQGGHYVPLVANRGNLVVVTWGRLQQMTPQFYIKYADEAYAVLSLEFLKSGKSPEGFNLEQLQADLASL
jgi:hypothetical protein